jgi:ketosteroid isomerase-like protein
VSASSEIHQTLYRLAAGTDLRDADLVTDSYTDDVHWIRRDVEGNDLVLEGRDAVLGHLRTTWSKGERPVAHHLITNIFIVTETDTEAEVTSYKTVVRVNDGKPGVVSMGWYRDILVNQDGTWRIKSRILNNDH